jgi:uncharacterized protein (DUF433 family)
MTHKEIIEDYPELKEEDIFATLSFGVNRECTAYQITV